MGSSLREQLLKAGLVDPQKARQAEAEQKRQRREQPRGKAPAADPAAARLAAEKAERDRELNRQRQEETRRRALAAEVADLVKAHAVPHGVGDLAYHFVDGKAVKRVYVTPAQQERLARGQLGIVRYGQGYALVPADIVERVRERDPSQVVLLAQPISAGDEQDAYAAYPVPDDLTW